MKQFTIRSLSLVLSTFAVVPLAAQASTFSAVRTQNYGYAIAGGTTTLRADAMIDDLANGVALRIDVSNIATVRLFGSTREAAAILTSVSGSHGLFGFSPATGPIFFTNSGGSYTVRLGGYTVATDAQNTSPIGAIGTVTANVFPGNGVGMDVWLIAFNVRVQGNVTGRANYDLNPQVTVPDFAIDLDGPTALEPPSRRSAPPWATRPRWSTPTRSATSGCTSPPTASRARSPSP